VRALLAISGTRSCAVRGLLTEHAKGRRDRIIVPRGPSPERDAISIISVAAFQLRLEFDASCRIGGWLRYGELISTSTKAVSLIA